MDNAMMADDMNAEMTTDAKGLEEQVDSLGVEK